MNTNVNENVKEIELKIESAHLKGELETTIYIPVTTEEQPSGLKRFVPSWLFTILVLIPFAAGFLYNFVIASDRFQSTASFVVRQTKNTGDLSSILQGGGLTRSDENSYAVTQFIQSRDAITAINHDGFLTQIFASSGLDFFSRFPTVLTGAHGEDFFKHFQNYIAVSFDTATGITTLSAQAFTPEQAQELTRRLVKASEELVNALNVRAQSDATQFAEKLVSESRKAMTDVQHEITGFRNENQILSAEAEVTISNGLIGGVMEGLTRVNTDITQQLASAPNSPRMRELLLRRDALVEQLDKLREGMVGGNGSIAKKLERFETLSIRQKIAQTNLVSAEAMLMKARQDSATEKLYLDNVVAPNIPDKFSYPAAFNNMALILFVGFSTFSIVRALRGLIMEEN